VSGRNLIGLLKWMVLLFLIESGVHKAGVHEPWSLGWLHQGLRWRHPHGVFHQ
jgi:hypothetical protein